MADDAYDLRSNIKGKPGSQGTLFQVKDKGLLNPQQRWPQGYTPERLGEVRQALRTTPVTHPQWMDEATPAQAQEFAGTNEFGYRERLHKEIAKTTIPPEHLQRFTAIKGDADEGTHGTYTTNGRGYPSKRELAIDVTDHAGSERTSDDTRKVLTHEIGHHVNMTLAPTPHVHDMVAQLHAHADAERESRTPTSTDVAVKRSVTAANVDEAQADDYAVEHFRTGGRKSKRTTTGAYEDNFSEHERAEHYPGYNDVRPPQEAPMSATGRALQENQFQPGLFPKSRAEGGLRSKMAAQADANRQALAAHIASVRGSQ